MHSLVVSVLQRAAGGLRNIVSLQLGGCLCLLPHPSQVPSLRHLSITTLVKAKAAWLDSVAAVLPQVTSLCYHALDGEVGPVLSASRTPLNSLTELVVGQLDTHIIAAVLRHHPQLRRIQARQLYTAWADYSRYEWAVQELAIGPIYAYQVCRVCQGLRRAQTGSVRGCALWEPALLARMDWWSSEFTMR